MGTLIRLERFRAPAEGASSNDVVDEEGADDRDLLPVAAILWVASLARAVYAFADGEEVNAEATLAVACVFLVPWLCFVSYRNARRGAGGKQA